ncbi:membrane-associated HD superfamily phosphohydrolase [Flavobacterium sp. PL11]|jgi:hypothetical protein|uniref:hypothetical protein n=1 Tax=Flavobacterium sp. PL11 TaxID=3071717 RepID=UPI002DFBF3A6|nr:membrane-associated HD superfamily phosphohydrolase [Flavobacterium sp. PL11]
MKIFKKNKLILLLPILLLVLYFCAGVFFDPKHVIYVKPLIIPTFMIYVLKNNLDKITLNYILFVMFFYINEVTLLFWENSLHFYRISLISSFFAYLTLVILGYKSIKIDKLQAIPSGYSLFILIINCIFLLGIVYLISSAITDNYINIIIVFNALITIVLGSTAVLYLSKFGNRKAYFYFFGAFALIFNDVFSAVGAYFIPNIFLNTLDRTLHFTAFYLIYLFTIHNTKKVENLVKDSQP